MPRTIPLAQWSIACHVGDYRRYCAQIIARPINNLLEMELWLINGYLFTGTDTDVGKTLIATGILSLANKAGLRTAAIKPIAAGSEDMGSGMQNQDALQLSLIHISEPTRPY